MTKLRTLFRSGLAGALCTAFLLAGAPTASAAKKFEVFEATIADVQSAILAREVTARQLVQLYLDRIAAYDQKGPALNCVISLNPAALAEADKLDAAFAKTGKLMGPMHGVVVLVKDEIDAVGMATTQGVTVFADYRPPLDAFVVAKLRKEGAIILGKTTLSEYAGGDTYSTMFGHSRNPYALDRTVGGSSGGSGGALAASFSTVTLGEETSSSLKRPAAWAASTGMRATPGLISRTGMWDGHPVPTAQMGPMARTVTDLAKLLDGMVGYDPEDPITAMGVIHTPKTYTAFLDKNALKDARIGVLRESVGGNSVPDSVDFKLVDAVFQKSLDELKAAGATVVDIVVPDLKSLMAKRTSDSALNDEALRVYLARTPNSPIKTRDDISNHPEFPKGFKQIMAKNGGSSYGIGASGGRGTGNRAAPDPAKILEGMRAREQLMINFAKVMADQKLDAIALKTVEHQPSLIAEATTPPYKSNGGTVSINTFMIYTPIITVPIGYSSGTIPAGLSFMGMPYSEPTLLKLAYAYEQATKHRQPPASTPPLAAK
jgi:Asp-tRNA(Asn)/Glu-tRNA(Gln) amidotransferase A subunit family amidase